MRSLDVFKRKYFFVQFILNFLFSYYSPNSLFSHFIAPWTAKYQNASDCEWETSDFLIIYDFNPKQLPFLTSLPLRDPDSSDSPASRHRPSLNQSNRLDFFEADHNLNTDPNWGRVKRRMNEIHKSFESLRCHQDENCPLCCCPYLSVEIICPHLYLS